MIKKIISGGQTGVDRAALDFALDHKIPCGGWCPKGRRAEDGAIPVRYPMQEADSPDYTVRTKRNVDHSDGTLIITIGQMDPGTSLTYQYAISSNKPCLVIDVSKKDYSEVLPWLQKNRVSTLDIAGPRESNAPGIYEITYLALLVILGN